MSKGSTFLLLPNSKHIGENTIEVIHNCIYVLKIKYYT